jgi:hypothetical protein
MQNQKKRASNAFCSPRYVSKLMKNIVDLFMQTFENLYG